MTPTVIVFPWWIFGDFSKVSTSELILALILTIIAYISAIIVAELYFKHKCKLR
jgi:uncharacterized membrane protein YqaE (UPF0057 family)